MHQTNKKPHVLAVSSFAVHGTASLKTFITLLGEKILPVPSLMLNGLTNMSLVKKLEPPFYDLLQSSFELARARELDLILYIGYLGKAEQADIILEMIDTYQDIIKTIITDPVCGDHGRTYVPAEVIAKWPELINKSDIVFPNITELKILTGNAADAEGDLENYAESFQQLFTNTKLVVTSVKGDDGIGVQVYGDAPYRYAHEILPKNYGGSGDAFLALFILNYFYRGLSFNQALKAAADQTLAMIARSIATGSDDLILEIPN